MPRCYDGSMCFYDNQILRIVLIICTYTYSVIKFWTAILFCCRSFTITDFISFFKILITSQEVIVVLNFCTTNNVF